MRRDAVWGVLIGLLVGVGALVAAGQTSDAQQPCVDPDRVVTVEFSRTRWPLLADHVADVRQDFEKVLHIDRSDTDGNRRAALRGVATAEGMDRDEYPPAMSAEGGAGADVRLVPSGENRSAGAYMGAALGAYCDGAHFRMVVTR
jgi:hypothetical protein